MDEQFPATPAHTLGVTRLGTRLVTRSDPTLLTPARAEELLAAAYVDGLLSSRTPAVEVVEFDAAGFWWTREQEPVRHPWDEGGANRDTACQCWLEAAQAGAREESAQ